MEDQDLETLVVPIEYHVPDGVVSRYATNLVVRHGEHEFILSFFEVQPPIMLGTHEQVEEQWQTLDAIRAECVARVVVAAEKMPSFIEALQTNLAKYREKQRIPSEASIAAGAAEPAS